MSRGFSHAEYLASNRLGREGIEIACLELGPSRGALAGKFIC